MYVGQADFLRSLEVFQFSNASLYAGCPTCPRPIVDKAFLLFHIDAGNKLWSKFGLTQASFLDKTDTQNRVFSLSAETEYRL